MSLEMTYPPPPQSLGEGLQVTKFDQCLHIIMVIGKCTVVFRGFFWFWGLVEGKGLCGRIFPWRNMSWGNRNSIKGAEFSKITIKKNNEKINMEKFFKLKVKSSIET